MYKHAARRGQSPRNALSGTMFGPAADYGRRDDCPSGATPRRTMGRKYKVKPAALKKAGRQSPRSAGTRPPPIVMSGTPTSGSSTPVMNPMLRAIWES